MIPKQSGTGPITDLELAILSQRFQSIPLFVY